MSTKSLTKRKEKPLKLPRLVPSTPTVPAAPPPTAKDSDSSLAVNVDGIDYLKTNVVNKYENWLYPGLSQTRFDGFDSCCSAEGQSSVSSAAKSLCRRIPNAKELVTLLFAPDEKSLLKWEKSGVLDCSCDYRCNRPLDPKVDRFGSTHQLNCRRQQAAKGGHHIENIQDEVIQSRVLRIIGKADGSVSIRTPMDQYTALGINLPYLNMIIRNLDCYFSFEIQILDNMGMKRLFRMSNFQTLVRLKPDSCSMPMRLDIGWNQVIIDLPAFVKDAFGTRYKETLNMKVNANIYVRRIYFSSELFDEMTLPAEYKLFPLGDLDKRPLYRERTEFDEVEFKLKDIVIPNINSGMDLLNGLFDTASGYIQIDEETWDTPKIVIQKADDGMELPPLRKPHSPRSFDSPQSVDSLKVFSSLEARHRMRSLIRELKYSPTKEQQYMPYHSSNMIGDPKQSNQSVEDLLEDLSEVFDFLAAASADLIPQASAETFDDLLSISESLKDMASFSGVWENKPDPEPVTQEVVERASSPPKLKGNLKMHFVPLEDEEVVLTMPGYKPEDGVPIHVAPYGDGSDEPSMQILNISTSKQVLAHAQIMERRRTLQNEADGGDKVPESPLLSSTSKMAAITPSTSCLEFAMRTYAASTRSLKEFASLSSTLLDKIGSSPKFVDKFASFASPSKTSVKPKTSSHEAMIHLRKLSLALKDIASVGSLEAIRQSQLDKASQIVEESPAFDAFENYDELQLPEYKGSIEIFNSYSSDCCVIKPDAPFLLRHSESVNYEKKESGMSLFDSNLSLAQPRTQTHTSSSDGPPDHSGAITTKFIKAVKKLSSEIAKNFSGESVQVLKEHISQNSMTPQRLDTDSQNLLTGFHSETDMELCSKLKPGKPVPVLNEIDEKTSTVSLKYLPSGSLVYLTPSPVSDNEVSGYEVQLNASADGRSVEQIEPFLNYDAIPCEAWQDFFLPGEDENMNCNDNIGAMSKIWQNFDRAPNDYPIGFSLPSTGRSSPLATGRTNPAMSECSSSTSGDTFHTNTTIDFTCGKRKTSAKNSIPQRFSKSKPGSEVPIFRHSLETPNFSVPASQSVSSSSSLPQSLAPSVSSSKGLISPVMTSKLPSKLKMEEKTSSWQSLGKNKRGTKLEKKSTIRIASKEDVLSSSAQTSLGSISDSDASEGFPSLKVLKKLCLEALKKPPENVLRESVIPTDDAFWAPLPESSDSSARSWSTDSFERSQAVTPASVDESSDECELSSHSSRQTLIMMSPPCSAPSSEAPSVHQIRPPSEHRSEEETSDEEAENSIYYWNTNDAQTPSLSSSSKTSSESSFGGVHGFDYGIDGQRSAENRRGTAASSTGKADLTTILAPDLSEAALFEHDTKKPKRGSLSSRPSISGLTDSTHRLLHPKWPAL